jgi:hypothetical protein
MLGQVCMTETAPEHKLVLRPREITVGGTALLFFAYMAAAGAGMMALFFFQYGDRITPWKIIVILWSGVWKSLLVLSVFSLGAGVMLVKFRKRARRWHWEASSEGIGIHHDGQQVGFLPWKEVRWITRAKDRISVWSTNRTQHRSLEGMTKEDYKKLKAMLAKAQ